MFEGVRAHPPEAGTVDETMATECVFCAGHGGRRLWRDARCRVVLTDEPFAGFCRVIWNAHVREMTDLEGADSAHIMRVVFAAEAVLRGRLQPIKMNLASLGNVTPHLHWHVVPRFADDTHFPQPFWGASQRNAGVRALPSEFAEHLAGDLAAALGPGLAL
jgi:diadenosine tetraphosphate (Ap4A) HIT family hydrolase